METVQPKLRFPDFKDNWDNRKLGQFTQWASGGTPPKDNVNYWNGDIAWISASSMRGLEYTNSELKITLEGLQKGSKLAKKGDLLLLVRGSMLFNKIPIGIAGIDVSFNQDLKSISVDNQVSNSKYILQWFFHSEPKVLNMVTGTGIGAGKLDLSDLKDLNINLPSLKEQTRIANFLSSVDEKLNLLKEKKALLEDYKKGIMQKIFNQEIRFKDDNGNDFEEWEEKSLGECLNFEQPTKYLVDSTDYNDSFKTPVLTAGKTFILGYTDEVNGIFKKEELPVIIFDDFTTATQFVNFPFKAKSSAMKILKAKENICIKFIYESMQNLKFEVGGHGRHWISIYSNLFIDLPTLKEQTKIANFFSAIDEKIALVSNQIQDTQEYKKGLLQQMFV
ncbi:restriction endonuclease subunit S [Flavobacterium psychrolimnae]|uniref:Restriction endonuclease subunit S n=1 Tax=Flavobacterium psychrolimnae TaxID=249351 RepID=A0A366AWW2_9FLAO|nr:restriction endonuclease subunit S [Flavobacterium psychrolimnae]RBN48893.1 restriction endonuclease subunit S [Flavobacterium psychrolimnae]